MNIQEKRKAFEKLLAGAPEGMSPLQVSKWTPYGRNTVYAMLRSGELPSIQYRGTYLISKAELVEYMTVRAVSELLGYRKQTVARWIAKGNLKSASTHGEPIIAKPWLADFCCHYGYHIVKKSEKHKKLEESFFPP